MARGIWIDETTDFHSAKRLLGWRGIVHLTVESMGQGSWDWHVWEASGWGERHFGLASTAEQAKAEAERALGSLTR